MAKLFSNSFFNRIQLSYQLIVLHVISRMNFEKDHRNLKGELSEFGECELTVEELCQEMTEKFPQSLVVKVIDWGLKYQFFSKKSIISGLKMVDGCFVKKEAKTQESDKNVYTPPETQSSCEHSIVHNSVHLGKIPLFSVKFRYSQVENAKIIVENFVHNYPPDLEKFDSFCAIHEKIQKSLIPPPSPFPLTIPIPLPPPGASSAPNPTPIKKEGLAYTARAGGDPATSATETEATAEPDGTGTEEPQRVISPRNGITGNLVAGWQREFPGLDIFAELEIFEAQLQTFTQKLSSIRNLKSYIYGYLRKRSTGKDCLKESLDNTSAFICLEKEVESRFTECTSSDNQTQTVNSQEVSLSLPAWTQHEVEQWKRFIYTKTIPKIAQESCLSKLYQPPKVLETIIHFVCKPGKLLTIQGPSGTGKSYIATVVTREMFRRKLDFIYLSASELSMHAKQTGCALDDVRNKLCVAPLLVVEDVAFEIKHYAFAEMVCCVINSRMEQDNRPTVFTTTLKPSVFMQALGIRLATKIAAESWIILSY